MIDFAHSTFRDFMDDKPYTGIDNGYILGIDSLLKFISQILDQMSTKFLNEPLVLHPNWHPLDESEVSNKLRKRKHEVPPTDSDTIFHLSC
ncbi:Kinase [Aphelenchoides bicaudatus]|nr:Kinase [Aphelenchoides bicaudatus]